jgi:hypothetical protein
MGRHPKTFTNPNIRPRESGYDVDFFELTQPHDVFIPSETPWLSPRFQSVFDLWLFVDRIQRHLKSL